MIQRLKSVGLFPILICAYAIYYLGDVWATKFETFGYGALCVVLVFVLSGILFLRTPSAWGGSGRWLDTRALMMLAILLVYAILQLWIGFALASLLASGAILWVMGYRNPLHLGIATVALAALAYIVLVVILGVPLRPMPWFS